MKVKKKSGIKKKVLNDMHEEMNTAVVRHMWAMTPLNPQMPDGQKLVVLTEEIGEVAEAIDEKNPELAARMVELAAALGRVARAMTYDNGDPAHLYRELIQVMTMSGAWAQSMRAGRPKDWVTT
jgi:hypothetical protein